MRVWNPFSQHDDSLKGEYSYVDDAPAVDTSWTATRRDRWTGFSGAVAFGTLIAFVVLIANLAILGWSFSRPTSNQGTRVLFQGDCDYVATTSTVAHLAINVLSSMLLAASNLSMQCLTAPIRENINAAHARGTWLNIGIGSIRNFFYIGRHRQAAWALLFLTSLPLHLLYNSVIIQSSSATEYNALLVTQDFTTGAPINHPEYFGIRGSYDAQNVTTFKQIQDAAHSYTKLDTADCIEAYATPFPKGHSNVVLVSNITSYKSETNSSVLFSALFSPSIQTLAYSVFYDSGQLSVDDWYFAPFVKEGDILPYMAFHNASEFSIAKIEYCLSQEIPDACSIELHYPFLVVVILMTVLKIACSLWILFALPSLKPLITVGDSIASFLEDPDPTTSGGRAVAQDFLDRFHGYVVEKLKKEGKLYTATRRKPWTNDRTCWHLGNSMRRRTVLVFVFIAWIVMCGLSLGIATNPPNAYLSPVTPLSTLWANGFGHVYPLNVLPWTLNWSLSANIVFANLPQLLLSVLYVCYNQYFTVMCASAETMRFAARRRTLRVSRPHGQQRSSYWLSLPFRYSMPLLGVSAALHWALSQSIFLAEVSYVTADGVVDESKQMNGVGWSLLGLVIMCSLGTLLLVVIVVVGYAFSFTRGMPVLGCCSLTISAACHGHDGRLDEDQKPLMYGVVEVTGDRTGRVGFSSLEVEPLQEGWYYDGISKTPPTPPPPQSIRRSPVG